MFWRFALLFLTVTTSLQSMILEDLIKSDELKQTFTGKKIGYYTGSFDPIHTGHKSFAQGVVDAGICDYVLIVPAWGGDGYKERAPISARLEMQYALFANDPHVIVTSLSPLEVQRALTTETPNQTVRGCSTVKPLDQSIEFIGLVGSDTALNLSIPARGEEEDGNRMKRLQVFMRGISIPEKHAETTIGSIMALPVSRFILGLRVGDDVSVLNGTVGDRPICGLYKNAETAHASSTLVKKRLQNGESVAGLIEPEVLEIIRKYQLYEEEAGFTK